MVSKKWALAFVGMAVSASILVAACELGLNAAPAPHNGQPPAGVAPVSGPDTGGPDGGSPRPITIIDDMDPSECNFIHNINTCFSDGAPPDGVDLGEYMDPYLKAALDLGHRLGVDPALVKLKEVEKVHWPDASLGNPEPDMFYAQVITPGFRMVLEANGQQYTYHTSMDHVVFVG